MRRRAAHRPRTLGWGDRDKRGRRCSQRSTAPVMPMHDRVDGDRQLTFAFVLGGGLRSWRAIGPTTPRVVGVAQARRREHSQRWPDEQDFRSGAEHQLDVGRGAVPRLVQTDIMERISGDYRFAGAAAYRPRVPEQTSCLQPARELANQTNGRCFRSGGGAEVLGRDSRRVSHVVRSEHEITGDTRCR